MLATCRALYRSSRCVLQYYQEESKPCNDTCIACTDAAYQMTGCPRIVSVQVETGVAVGARANLGENDVNR